MPPNKAAWDVAIWGTYPPPYGGMAMHIVRLMARLKQEGIRSRVFNRTSEAENRPEVVSIRNWQKRWFVQFALSAKEPVLYIFTGRPSVRFLAYLLKRVRGKKYVLRVGEERILQTMSDGRRLDRFMTRVALRNADHVVVVSPHLRDIILDSGVPASRVSVVPGFIPPADLDRQPNDDVIEFAKRHHPVLSANGQLAAVNNTSDPYGIEMLAVSLAELKQRYPDIGLLLSLYGRNNVVEGQEAFRQRIDELGLGDSVLLCSEPHIFWPTLKCSDVFVRPTRTEGDSGSIREAIFLGVPVVASDAAPRPAPSVLFANGAGADLTRKLQLVLNKLDSYKETFRQAELPDNAAPIVELMKQLLA